MIIPLMRKHRETFFLNHLKLTLLIAAVACAFSYFFVDIPLAQYFEHISRPTKAVFKIITESIDPNYHYFAWAVIYFAVAFLWKKQRLANRCLLILLSIPLANLAMEIIKCTFGRARPDLLFSQDLYGFTFFSLANRFKSFPSGHAATAGAIFGALSCFYPRATAVFTLLAFVMAFSRIVLTYHYLSDVIAGLTFGLLISQWVYVLMKKNNISF